MGKLAIQAIVRYAAATSLIALIMYASPKCSADDFSVMLNKAYCAGVLKQNVEAFKREVGQFYDMPDIEKGTERTLKDKEAIFSRLKAEVMMYALQNENFAVGYGALVLRGSEDTK